MAGRARAEELATRLGVALRESRMASGLIQADVARSAGVVQSFVSRMERGLGASASLETWAAVAVSAGAQLAAFLEELPGAARPRDYEHLKRQQLVVEAAVAGGWRATIEHPTGRRSDRPASVDVRLDRAERRETAIIEIWDWFDDVGAAYRGFDEKLTAASREHARRELGGADPWRVSGVIVVRATRRNRQLVREFRTLFRTRFPGTSATWLASIGGPAPMPAEPGLLWTDVRGARLFAARL